MAGGENQDDRFEEAWNAGKVSAVVVTDQREFLWQEGGWLFGTSDFFRDLLAKQGIIWRWFTVYQVWLRDGETVSRAVCGSVRAA